MLFIYFVARESCGGTRLLRRADINIGSHVNTFVRVRCKLSDPASSKPISGPAERRHTVIYGKYLSLSRYTLMVSRGQVKYLGLKL